MQEIDQAQGHTISDDQEVDYNLDNIPFNHTAHDGFINSRN